MCSLIGKRSEHGTFHIGVTFYAFVAQTFHLGLRHVVLSLSKGARVRTVNSGQLAASVHLSQKLPSRWTNLPSCTNFQIRSLLWGDVGRRRHALRTCCMGESLRRRTLKRLWVMIESGRLLFSCVKNVLVRSKLATVHRLIDCCWNSRRNVPDSWCSIEWKAEYGR